MEKYWNLTNIPEPDLPEIDEEKLKIKDKAVLRELHALAAQNPQQRFKLEPGSEKYKENYDRVFEELDQVAKASSQGKTRWIYYDLEDTDTSEKEMMRGAFDFLDEIRKRAEKQENKPIEKDMTEEYKPKFVTDQNRMSNIIEKKPNPKCDPKKNVLLSFSDELQ